MVEYLSLSNYGNIAYSYEALINNYGVYDYMSYNNYDDEITVDCYPIADFGMYNVSIWNKNELKNLKSNNLNKFIQAFLYQASNPIIYNWDNARNKNDNSFTLTIGYFGKEIDISFDKSYTVVYIANSGLVTVYSDPEYKNCIESYQFTKEGFFCNNLLNKMGSAATKDGFMDFKLYMKKEKINNRILDFLPTLVDVSSGDNNQNNSFRIYYDEYGVITKVMNDKTVSRYECLFEEDSKIIRSIYPNLYDCLDPNYIDFSLTNWAEMEVTVYEDKVLLKKNVFRINKDKYDDFLNCLYSNQSIPIIDITE